MISGRVSWNSDSSRARSDHVGQTNVDVGVGREPAQLPFEKELARFGTVHRQSLPGAA